MCINSVITSQVRVAYQRPLAIRFPIGNKNWLIPGAVSVSFGLSEELTQSYMAPTVGSEEVLDLGADKFLYGRLCLPAAINDPRGLTESARVLVVTPCNMEVLL